MKKIITLTFYSLLISLPSNITFAAEEMPTLKLENPLKKWDLLEGLLKGIVPIIIGLATIVFVVMILVSGYYFLISAGDEQKSAKAKKSLVGAVVGLAVVGVGYLAVMWAEGKLRGN